MLTPLGDLAAMLPPLVPRAALCKLLDVQPKTVRQMERDGKIPLALAPTYKVRLYERGPLLAALARLFAREGGGA